MLQGPNLEVLKEIPGYHVILRAILKSQIQLLVEQLANQAGEEAVVLTASVADGTLSHLGSRAGNIFLDDHDEIKSQFLGFCLNRQHKRKSEDLVSLQPQKRIATHQAQTPQASRTNRTTPLGPVPFSPITHGASAARRGRNALSINNIASNLRERSSPVRVTSSPIPVALTRAQQDISITDEQPFIQNIPAQEVPYETPKVGWDEDKDINKQDPFINAEDGRNENSRAEIAADQPVVVKVEKYTGDDYLETRAVKPEAGIEGKQMNELDWSLSDGPGFSQNSCASSMQGGGEEGYQAKINFLDNDDNQEDRGGHLDLPLNTEGSGSFASPRSAGQYREKYTTARYKKIDSSMYEGGVNEWSSPGWKSEGELVGRGTRRVEKLIKCDVCSHVCRTSNMARHKKRYCTGTPVKAKVEMDAEQIATNAEFHGALISLEYPENVPQY